MTYIGTSPRRVEDDRILRGRGRYVDDLARPGMLHAAFVRSPFAHARVTAVDVAAARALPGVVAVFTGDEIAAVTRPMCPSVPYADFVSPSFTVLATDRVRFVGDPVAIVVAEDRYVAEDACELVEVDYDPLPPVATFAAALDAAIPPLFDELDDNVLVHSRHDFGDVDGAFAAADRVVRETFRQSRQANVPIETRGAVVDFDAGTGMLDVHAATQSVHGLRFHLAEILDHPIDRVRVRAGDVGGAFGLKGPIAREHAALAAAGRIVGRPVKWIEDRNEHLLAAGHAREEQLEVEAAVRSDGTVLGLRARLLLDQGAYPAPPYPAAMLTLRMRQLLPGPYRVGALSFETTIVATNKCWYVPYRGPWEIETWARERMLDVVARELAVDPVELRRRNVVDGAPGDALVTGPSLAGVSSRESLERAVAVGDYGGWRAEQQRGRSEGRAVGVGVATFIEPSPGSAELRAGDGEEAVVRLEPNGTVLVVTSQSPHGQGHETTLAQLAAETMGVALDDVRVVHGDTLVTPVNLIGTGGSRAATWASGAVLVSARALRQRVLALASALLEIAEDDLEIVDGRVTPRGVPGRAVPLAEIAQAAHLSPRSLPPGTDHRLEAREMFTGAGVTGSGWAGGTHLCAVEVDLETGQVRILRYLVVEDCGRMINPAIVEGQVRGGVAQGIAGVLYEHAAYDDDGQFLAGTFMDYLLPTASEIPRIDIEHLESDHGDGVDFRGVGEGGAVVAPAALTNAIEDALAHLGVRVTEQYLPPSRILELAGVIPAQPS